MYKVDFKKVDTIGFENSPVADKLAGLRAHEARYFFNKFKHEFVTVPANEDLESLHWVENILKERDMIISSEALEISSFQIDNMKYVHIYYKNGLGVNVMYSLNDNSKRAVGFKLSEGMDIPEEFEGKFKFARQKSALAGTIRGSFFVIKGEY